MNNKRTTVFLAGLFSLVGLSSLTAQGDSCQVAELISIPGPTTLNLNADGPATGTGTTLTFGEQRSADWYIFTAPADGVISISSCGGGSDTYLRVHEGTCDTLDLIEESDDACDADNDPNNKNSLLASELRAVFVSAGTTYFIEWAGIWDTDPFSWVLSFTETQADGAPIGGVPFTEVPLQQAGAGLPIVGRVRSNGPGNLSGATLSARVLDDNGQLLVEGSSPVPPITPDTSREVEVFTWNSAQEGAYTIEYILQGGNNGFTGNDTLRVDLLVSSVSYAMDRATGPGSGAITLPDLSQGQVFDFFASDTIRVVSALLFGGEVGEEVQIQVFAFNGEQPGSLVAESNRITLSQSAPGKVFFNLEPGSGGFPVADGDQFLFALTHYNDGSSNILLGKSGDLFFPGRSWIRSGGTSWQSLEGIGIEQTMAIQLSNDFRAQELTVQVDMQDLALAGQLAGEVNVLWKTADGSPQYTPMVASPDSTYRASLPVRSLDQVFYLFVNGDGSLPEQREAVPGSCGQAVDFFGSAVPARRAVMGFSDREEDLVCFASCESCNNLPCGSATTIICDDIEAYDLGEVGPQADHWASLGSSADGLVTSGEANSGQQAVLIDGTISGQDVLLLLGDQTSGAYELSWRMYKPAGKKAYYNIQHSEAFGNYAAVLFFLEGGIGTFRLNPDSVDILAEFSFPEDGWFEVRHLFDLDQNQARLYINGQAVYAWDFQIGSGGNTNQLGSINFFPFNLDYRYLVDDIFFQEVPSGVANDICTFGRDIDDLLGQDLEVPQLSSLQDNRQAGSDDFDPSAGTDCFEDLQQRDNTLWYRFSGDGQRYRIETAECNSQSYIGNTQLALYSGSDCSDLQPVACGEGGETLAGSLNFLTEEGTSYYLMVDGFNAGGIPAAGEFCLEVTRTEEVTSIRPLTREARLRIYPNPATDRTMVEMELPGRTSTRLQLFNLAGQQVRAWSLAGPEGRFQQEIGLEGLEPGLYLLRMQAADQIFSQKLIIR